jgi:hypothetical protein
VNNRVISQHDTATAQPRPAGRYLWLLSVAGAMLLLSALVMNFAGWVANMIRAVTFPHQLDYGEGIVWQQAIMIMRGEGYGDINDVPHIIFHYPPVFHVTAELVASWLGVDGLAAGRLVSVLSAFGSAALIGYLAWLAAARSCGTLSRSLASVSAGLFTFAFMPIAYWSALYRVDNLAMFLTLAGVSLGLFARGRLPWVLLSSLFLVLAVFTKQTMIAGPLALYLTLALRDWRSAVAGLASSVALGLLLLLALHLHTQGGFLRNVVSYNVNRLDLENLTMVSTVLKYHLMFIVIPVAWLLLTVLSPGASPAAQETSSATQVRVRSRLATAELFAVSYLLICTLLLPLVLKSGAAFNYLIEWMNSLSIILGIALAPYMGFLVYSLASSSPVAPLNKTKVVTGALVTISLALQVAIAAPQTALFGGKGEKWLAEQRLLSELIASARQHVISDDMVSLLRSSKGIYLEPAIVAELSALGRFDEKPVLAQVGRREFSMIVAEGRNDGLQFRARYTPAMREAILRYYPVERELAGYTVHLPPGAPH